VLLLCLLPGRDSFSALRWAHEPVIDFRMPGNLSKKILSALSRVLACASFAFAAKPGISFRVVNYLVIE
jgi:hypothetical protein